MTVDRRRLLFALYTVAAVALAAAPAVVVFGAGWLTFGAQPKAPPGAVDRTPEKWVLFVLVYVAWLLALMVLTIVVNDRLGRHWRSWDRVPRPQKKRRRRLAAGLRYAEAQERERAAGAEAARARRARRAAPARRPQGGAGPGGASGEGGA